jgi:hypothetical protein
MIDPANVINYNRTDAELQEWWLFSIAVAGKPAFRIARQLDKFLQLIPHQGLPFEKLEYAIDGRSLYTRIVDSKMGQHSRIFGGFYDSVKPQKIDLRHASVDELEKVHGVGPKTARMFVMHSRPDQRHAALDTHILKHLAVHGHDVPKSTPPSGRRYQKLEQAFLRLADKAGMSPSEYDLDIWKSYSRAA